MSSPNTPTVTYVVATRPWKYVGQPLDRGEVFALNRLKVTEAKHAQLESLKYFVKFEANKHKMLACENCGRKFAFEDALVGHKQKPDCFADTQEITKADVAASLEVDPVKVKVD